MFNRRSFLTGAGAALISAPNVLRAQTIPKQKLRIVVVANRDHEADGLMAALCNQMAHSPNLSAPYQVKWPRWSRVRTDLTMPMHERAMPRCLVDVFKTPSDMDPAATMEIWCIDDLAFTDGNSAKKLIAMGQITEYAAGAPDGVIAFGTAAYPGLPSNNGCAAIGGTIFIHDASRGAHEGWSWPGHMGMLVPSRVPATFFSNVSADQILLVEINSQMIAPQNRPASVLQLVISADAVGISSVNETPPYCEADTNAIVAARQAGAANITSVETTHGVIRSMWDKPFIYVSAISNRICHFPDEAAGLYGQEFPASHNAGIALKYVVPHFVAAIA
ncbi:hypothetical protein [Segnochrobactrum spirostomi]|uniref:Uncharacterized protein n=1 Tax=Segnochrobactrum spirostomi TaxID=2608987 RepID=A0A6A7YBW8_9HYPH|nr:hypothetical protein [Segnochrobactrum spirostomi]MQT15468.1 hypothetical protein [Segnochrobactrum spirostomi]